MVLWAGFVGAGAVLGYSGQVLRLVTTAVRDVAKEIERQLRRFPRERGIPAIPEDFAPSYRTCIDLATRRALSKWLLPVAAIATVPAGVAFASAFVGGTDPSVGAETLVSFLTAAAATGLGAALIVDSAGALLVAGHRVARQRGSQNDPEGTNPTSTGDAIANILRSGAGAPALLTMKVVAIVTLVIMPFVT
jgi:Na+/H+-translocating membrane pyrophosphatase